MAASASESGVSVAERYAEIYWDMVLLRLFPNRTLEELDAIS